MNPRPAKSCGTSFASARRADAAQLRVQRDAFRSDPLAVGLLEAMPGPAMVVNPTRQIVAVNHALLETLGAPEPEPLMGLRPGEALGCRHSDETPGGCGTTRHCAHCGAVNAMLECLVQRQRVTRECRILMKPAAGGRAYDFRVHATHMTVRGQSLVILGLEDIAGDKRRRVLEQVFLHELLDTFQGLRDLAGEVRGEGAVRSDAGLRAELVDLSQVAFDQVETQRQLLAAEEGSLKVEPDEVDVPPLLESVAERFRRHPEARDREIRLEFSRRCRIRSDAALLRTVVGSLLRNALEATPPGGTVSVSCELAHDVATLSVHNDGVIPEDVQLQIFQRSFSTKGPRGRGVGTYGAKLIAEQYLKGHVEFVSNGRLGTLFVVMIPNLGASAVAL